MRTLSGTLARQLGQKINPIELAQARLSITADDEPLGGPSQNLTEFRCIQDFCIAYGFEQEALNLLAAHVRLMELLIRQCKRHLNSIKLAPPPASLASRTLNHLTEFSALIGKPDSLKLGLATTIEDLSRRFGEAMRALLESKTLRLVDLDRPLLPEMQGKLSVIGRGLADEVTLLDGAITLLENTFSDYLKTLTHYEGTRNSTWLHFKRRDKLDLSFQDQTETTYISRESRGPGWNYTPQVGDLIRGDLNNFVLNIHSCSGTLHDRIGRLNQLDAKLFSRQFRAPHLEIENTLLIQSLCHHLRLSGEPADDVESFAKRLMHYATKNEVHCSSILESEVLELAARLSPSGVINSLRHVKYDDAQCPLSVAHKNSILNVVALAEQLLDRLTQPTPSEPRDASTVLSSQDSTQA